MAIDSKIQAKFGVARAELAAALIERDEEVDMLLTAMVAREHALLVGPPGVAKSLLVDSLVRWADAKSFSVLMTKTLNPEDVFGPLNIDAFVREQRWERVTSGWLPEAEIAFLDEIWKSSSAVLNTLLKLLNEGLFQNNGAWTKTPLRLAVAASNEWPSPDTGQELSALLDRFLFRKTVRPVATRAGEDRLYDFENVRGLPQFSDRITPAEIDRAAEDAAGLGFEDDAKEAFREIVAKLAAEGIRPGDRRKYKAVGAARAAAYLAGNDVVTVRDLEVLQFVLWDDPREQPAKAAQIVCQVANPDGARVNALLEEAEQVARGYDARDLKSYSEADAKLQEISRQLRKVKDNAKAKRGLAFVAEEVKRIRLATVASGL